MQSVDVASKHGSTANNWKPKCAHDGSHRKWIEISLGRIVSEKKSTKTNGNETELREVRRAKYETARGRWYYPLHYSFVYPVEYIGPYSNNSTI